MKTEHGKRLESELKTAVELYEAGSYEKCFSYLERVHILGQRSVYWHTLSHVYMLRVALRTFNLKEVFGQLVRLPLAVLGSVLGIVPTGNTGGSNVGLFKKMPIPDDFRRLLER